MQKEEIVRRTARKNHFPIGLTGAILNALLIEIRDEVAQGERITFMDFGTFNRIWREERMGINPQTKDSLHIPGHYAVSFRPGKEFREKVNKATLNMNHETHK